MSSRASVSSRATAIDFEPEAQELPLNQNAINQLDNIRRRGLRHDANVASPGLDDCLKRAAELLNSVVAEVNERAHEERTRWQNREQKRKQRGEDEPEGEVEQYEEFQEKVKDSTKKMDLSTRQVVDDQTWSATVPTSLKHVIDKSADVHARQEQARRQSEQDEEDGEDSSLAQPLMLSDADHASSLLQAAQSTAETQWQSQSLTDRYSQNQTYSDFYKVKFDAQNQTENPPPLPHHSIWFAAEEGRQPQRNTQRGTQRSNTLNNDDEEQDEDSAMQEAEDEDTELQMVSENVSCKCPLTMVWFKEPMTSTKCPHSFERGAIEGLIHRSTDTLPLTAEQTAELDRLFPRGQRGRPEKETQIKRRDGNARAARCPDAGCQQMLTENDIRLDVRLQQQSRRKQREEQKALEEEHDVDDEDESSGDDAVVGTQRRRRRIVAIGSSPSAPRRSYVKPERNVSVVPNSQAATQGRSEGRRGGFMDVDDADDDDDDADEE